MRKKICVFTGTRAEYGLLRPLIDEIKNDRDLQLQLIVTGMHLSHEHGLTYHEIENDGFVIDDKVEILLSSDTPIGISKSVGLAIMALAESYARLNPDIIVGLGDRFELFAAVAAALIVNIPVAHIGGGELTEGVFDDAFRHSITKMSHLHFTSTNEYRKRVIQLGEHPRRVFNVGEIGLDDIKRLKLLSREQLEAALSFNLKERNMLVTFHPVTLERNTSEKYFQNLLCVLDELEGTSLIFTKANADTDGQIINDLVEKYVSERPEKAIVVASLGRLKYLSAMQYSDAVVGNSSSGIVEAPSFKIGSINIGDRQKGRIRAASVIDCEPTKESIRNAFRRLYSADFQKLLNNVENPFGDGKSAGKILHVLKESNFKNILKKQFYDIEVMANE